MCQCESDGSLAFTINQLIGPVHLIANVVGNHRIERCLGIRQFIVGTVGASLREQWGAVELEQLLLHHATHHVGDIHLVGAFAEFAVEAVTIQQ